MKIRSIEVFAADIALGEPFRIAIMEITSARSVFVRVHTDQGVYGTGEANPTWAITGETRETNLAAATDLASLLLGRDPLNLEERNGDLGRYLTHNSTLRSAFDMALYDIAGKAFGQPLYSLLGGGRRLFFSDRTIGIDEPERMAAKALEYRAQGYKTIKLKLGTGFRADVARVEAVRRAVGNDAPIRVDANQGWDYKTAASTLKAIEPLEVEYCEQPVPRWDWDGMRRLREATSIAIMADEAMFDHHDAYRL
ncbi:MAG: dipeptide epimerase, partial [Pseudomonadota bacterium]